MSAADASPLRSALARLAAAAVLACGLATGIALATPQDASAVVTKLGTPAITSIQSSADKFTKHPAIKLAAKKVKGASHYEYWVYKGTKATGKPYIKFEWCRRCPTLSNDHIRNISLKEKQTYTVKVRAVKIGGYYKDLASWDESTWTSSKWSKPKTVTIKPVQYKINYENLNGGSLPEGDPPKTFTRFTPTFKLPVPTREGYVFKGWSARYKVNINGYTYHRYAYDLTEVEEGTYYDLNLTAQWTR